MAENNTNGTADKSNAEQAPDEQKEHFPNPFKEKVVEDKPLSTEEEADLEQQRKEALTERD